MPYSFLNIIEDKRFPIISSQSESLLMPYQHDLMVRYGVLPVVTLGWLFVQPSPW